MEKDKIVIVGRSNVGKSSALRALTGKAVRVGRRPGVTLKPNFIPYKGKTLVDMPGFGFMSGISEKERERIKDFRDYLEYVCMAIDDHLDVAGKNTDSAGAADSKHGGQ